jgi:hypothetical protein
MGFRVVGVDASVTLLREARRRRRGRWPTYFPASSTDLPFTDGRPPGRATAAVLVAQ